MTNEPFHEGERRVQQRVGETGQADRNAPMIAPFIPAGAIPFIEQQPLLVLAVLDGDAMWCLPAVGKPGWLSATRQALHLDLKQTIGPLDQRVLQAARNRQLVGGILLDFATRRRLRINGSLEAASEDLIVLTVAEAYPNCPKYITQRALAWSEPPSNPEFRQGQALTPQHQEALRNTDIFFLATQHPERGPDASHRGGTPGFIETPADGTFRFRDFEGNSIYNTLGNLEVDQRVGVLVPNFSGEATLAITGTASVTYEDYASKRSMTVNVESWTEVPFFMTQTSHSLSPFNPSGL